MLVEKTSAMTFLFCALNVFLIAALLTKKLSLFETLQLIALFGILGAMY